MIGNVVTIVLIVVFALSLIARCDVHRAGGQIPATTVSGIDPSSTVLSLADVYCTTLVTSKIQDAKAEQPKGDVNAGVNM